MDILTHMALGGVVGELALGKRAGNWAVLWGALGGLLPEIDRLLPWTHDDLTYLLYRQSFTHCLLFILVAAWLMGRLTYRLHRKRLASRRGWVKLWFWVLLTHVALDCCGSWGTQLFYPIWGYRVAGSFIATTDPLFTVPLLAGLALGLRHHRDTRPRNLWIGIGLVLSSLYLLVTVTNQQFVRAVFDHAFRQGDSDVLRMATYPTLGNNLLWYGIAEMPYGYQVGYFSVFEGAQADVALHFLPKYHSLPDSLISLKGIQDLRQVSDRYYLITTQGDSTLWHDLRFGLPSILYPKRTAPAFIYSWLLAPSDVSGQPKVMIQRDKRGLSLEQLQLTWQRIMGDSPEGSESQPVSDAAPRK
jgi:inner membrane protein